MKKNFVKLISDLRSVATEFILSKASLNPDSCIVFAGSTPEVCYASSDGGYLGDDLARIDSNGTIHLVEEGSRFYETYDFDEDPYGIVSAHGYGLSDLTIHSLCHVADRISNSCTTYFTDSATLIVSLAFIRITQLCQNGRTRQVSPVTVSIDSDCHWLHVTVTKVSIDQFMDDHGIWRKFDDVDGFGTTLDDEEIIKIASHII